MCELTFVDKQKAMIAGPKTKTPAYGPAFVRGLSVLLNQNFLSKNRLLTLVKYFYQVCTSRLVSAQEKSLYLLDSINGNSFFQDAAAQYIGEFDDIITAWNFGKLQSHVVIGNRIGIY